MSATPNLSEFKDVLSRESTTNVQEARYNGCTKYASRIQSMWSILIEEREIERERDREREREIERERERERERVRESERERIFLR